MQKKLQLLILASFHYVFICDHLSFNKFQDMYALDTSLASKVTWHVMGY